MSTDRPPLLRRLVVIGARLLLAAPFVLGLALLCSELSLRSNLSMLTGNFRCLRGNAYEPTVLLPGCRGTVLTPRGEMQYESNEDGLRDRPRSVFSRGAIYVIGDSVVEGPWLRPEETLSRQLEARLSPPIPYPFLNAGIRGAGPTQEAVRAYVAMKNYPLKGLIWVLNPTDPLDEIYFYRRNPGYELHRESLRQVKKRFDGRSPVWPALFGVSAFFGDRLLTLLYVLDHFELQGQFLEAVRSQAFDEKLHCRAIHDVAAELHKAGAPLAFVAFPHGPREKSYRYLGAELPADAFERLLHCAEETGSPVIRAWEGFSFKTELYWDGDWHLNPDGNRQVADYLAGQLRGKFNPAGNR